MATDTKRGTLEDTEEDIIKELDTLDNENQSLQAENERLREDIRGYKDQVKSLISKEKGEDSQACCGTEKEAVEPARK